MHCSHIDAWAAVIVSDMIMCRMLNCQLIFDAIWPMLMLSIVDRSSPRAKDRQRNRRCSTNRTDTTVVVATHPRASGRSHTAAHDNRQMVIQRECMKLITRAGLVRAYLPFLVATSKDAIEDSIRALQPLVVLVDRLAREALGCVA